MAKQIAVLIVEDHEQFRQFVSKVLRQSAELQVITEVADGMEAVQKARELRPELILLDIGLPTLNGIEVARRIRDVSPASKVLFVSENRSSDIVEAALNTGAFGYVVKSDAGRDLLPAVKAALAGKRFVSASLAERDLIVSSRPKSAESSRHELRLYSDDVAFIDDFAHSIEAALENGDAMVVVATESHRANLLQKLRTDGVDIDAASERKFYIPLDVSDSLPTVMDTSTDQQEFAKGMPRAIVEAVRTAKERHLHLAVG